MFVHVELSELIDAEPFAQKPAPAGFRRVFSTEVSIEVPKRAPSRACRAVSTEQKHEPNSLAPNQTGKEDRLLGDWVAIDEFGLYLDEMRNTALPGACFVGALLAFDFVGRGS